MFVTCQKDIDYAPSMEWIICGGGPCGGHCGTCIIPLGINWDGWRCGGAIIIGFGNLYLLDFFFRFFSDCFNTFSGSPINGIPKNAGWAGGGGRTDDGGTRTYRGTLPLGGGGGGSGGPIPRINDPFMTSAGDPRREARI